MARLDNEIDMPKVYKILYKLETAYNALSYYAEGVDDYALDLIASAENDILSSLNLPLSTTINEAMRYGQVHFPQEGELDETS